MHRESFFDIIFYILKKDKLKKELRSYFTHYSCVVFILFNMGLCRSAFSTMSLEKLISHLTELSMFFVESSNLNRDIKCVLLFFKKVVVAMSFFSHVIKTYLINNEPLMKIILCKKYDFREVLSFSNKIISEENS